jgi:murein DD-endopeptidase MepM/ murein hydrolase activator NlpD
MRESLMDSSEDLYSYTTTTTTDIFDFSEAEDFVSEKVLPAVKSRSFLTILISLLGSVKALGVAVFGISFELVHFFVSYLLYVRSKALQFIRTIDVTKDRFVDTLMWRRGLLFRPATHGGVMVVTALAIVAGGLFTRGQIAAQDLTSQESVLRSANTTETIVPTNRPRSEVLDYRVASGDTLSTLSNKFSVSVESIKWANAISEDSDTIHPGTSLKIPPVTGVVYKVKEGDNLENVAKTYAADKQTIADFPFNYIDDSLSLRPGQTLYVPNGVLPRPAAPKIVRPRVTVDTAIASGSGILSWPVPARISQYYSWFHPAIDIANPHGTPIYAAASGKVIDSKKLAVNFGWYCIVDIGDGYTVAYAHMSDLACNIGETVQRGQYIGAVGSTGRSTGPHLHLEVRRYGQTVNPLALLK